MARRTVGFLGALPTAGGLAWPGDSASDSGGALADDLAAVGAGLVASLLGRAVAFEAALGAGAAFFTGLDATLPVALRAGRRAAVGRLATAFFGAALRAALVAFLAGVACFAGAGRFVVALAGTDRFRSASRAFGLSCARLATARAGLVAAARAFTLAALFFLGAALACAFGAGRTVLAVLADVAVLAVLAAFADRAFGGVAAFVADFVGRFGLVALVGALPRAGVAFGRGFAAVGRDFGFSAAFGAALRSATTRDGLALGRAAASLTDFLRPPLAGADFAPAAAFLAGAVVFTLAVTLRIC